MNALWELDAQGKHRRPFGIASAFLDAHGHCGYCGALGEHLSSACPVRAAEILADGEPDTERPERG